MSLWLLRHLGHHNFHIKLQNTKSANAKIQKPRGPEKRANKRTQTPHRLSVYSPRTSEATLNRSNVFWSSYILRWLNSPVSPKSRFAFFLRGKDQGTQSVAREKFLTCWHQYFFDWRMSLRSISLRWWLLNIRTKSPPMFRSCSLVSQTPVKLGSQSRTWSQQLADRQMPKSWFSAKSDPALIWHSTLLTIAERPKTNVTYFA